MKQKWERLETWLKVYDPDLLVDLNPPAREANIQDLEQVIGAKLPAGFVACLKVHDGQKGMASSLFTVGRYLSLEDILSEWAVWRALFDQGEFDDRFSEPDPEIKDGWWRLGWIPFVSNGFGDHLCLDLDPAPSGRIGQIIEVLHDFESRRVVSSNFDEWFAGEVKAKCNE